MNIFKKEEESINEIAQKEKLVIITFIDTNLIGKLKVKVQTTSCTTQPGIKQRRSVDSFCQ